MKVREPLALLALGIVVLLLLVVETFYAIREAIFSARKPSPTPKSEP